MAPRTFELQFGAGERARLHALATLPDVVHVTEYHDLGPDELAEIEVLITSWGAPRITPALLDAMPTLRAIIHSAGSVRDLVPPQAYERGIQVSTAADMNAVPVAEYTLAAIIMAGKRALPLAARARRTSLGWGDGFAASDLSNLGRTVGLIGFSKIGRRVLRLLSVLETGPILVSDPLADPAEVAAAGAELVELEDLLGRCDIVSVHAPLLPSTQHMLGERELGLMRPGATLINTARGGLIDHDALVRHCSSERLDAILDVTDPEPLPPGHPLLALENVTVTPHVAGSLGTETRRLSRHALDALEAYTTGAPMPGAVVAETSGVSA
ncbi:hydroxyacid dehydrogenase [Serinibacter salmoneus]|uniref:Phosphoglycerate dehydrogenase-like enzyme n=1 Tax=Serinibacter salmoneus TaxID=556530 RepID=A0A2A9CZE9_9MICO|nr:hydroxyacid dehydrogenase [Serinibacter salmoneus]PFG19072.1 phosphoglycerate dehydrogenase-like enzyme [Serinibacter salmoneus]